VLSPTGCCKVVLGSNPGLAPHGGLSELIYCDEEICKQASTTAGEIIGMLYRINV